MEKKSLLARKPDAVFVDAVVTVAYAMTYAEYMKVTTPMLDTHPKFDKNPEGVIGYGVIEFCNGVQTGEMKWGVASSAGATGRKTDLAFSEALSASRLGMFVARKAWDEYGIAMHPIDITWPIETKGLPPLWARTKNKCNMPLNLNVPDFIANDWYIVDELPERKAKKLIDHFAEDFPSWRPRENNELSDGNPSSQMNDMMRDAVMDRGNSKELHDKIVNDILNQEHNRGSGFISVLYSKQRRGLLHGEMNSSSSRTQMYPQNYHLVKMAATDNPVNAADIEKSPSAPKGIKVEIMHDEHAAMTNETPTQRFARQTTALGLSDGFPLPAHFAPMFGDAGNVVAMNVVNEPVNDHGKTIPNIIREQPASLDLNTNLNALQDSSRKHMLGNDAENVLDADINNSRSDWGRIFKQTLSMPGLIGMLELYYGQEVPNDYLVLDGSAIPIADYPIVFAALGTQYGAGDGDTTFNLPDLNREWMMKVK